MQLSVIPFEHLKRGQLVKSIHGKGTITSLDSIEGQNMITILLENTKIVKISHEMAEFFQIT